jgi:hypothetical protein
VKLTNHREVAGPGLVHDVNLTQETRRPAELVIKDERFQHTSRQHANEGAGPSPLPSPRFAGRGQTVARARTPRPDRARPVFCSRVAGSFVAAIVGFAP